LNRINPSHFLGGEMPLDSGKAMEGVREKVAKPLGLDTHEAAFGILRIANTLMSLAVREVSLARGYDPRDFALLAFGGAGPLHALDIARDLHIPTVLVPSLPAHFSAIGMILTDIRHDYVQTYYRSGVEASFMELASIFEEMTQEGKRTLAEEGVPPEAMVFGRTLDVRYAGQEFTLPVRVTDEVIQSGDINAIKREFDALHNTRYGDSAADPIEIVNARVAAIGRRPKPTHAEITVEWREGAAKKGSRPVYLESGKNAVDCEVYQRELLHAGDFVPGPAIIEEYASTVVLSHGDKAVIEPTGEMKVSVASAGNTA
jgi:N-methylhydantoinase A